MRLLLAEARDPAVDADLAFARGTLSVRLAAVGAHAAALTAAQQSVTAFRALDAGDPVAFRHALAAALRNMCAQFAALRLDGLAFEASQEAATLFSALSMMSLAERELCASEARRVGADHDDKRPNVIACHIADVVSATPATPDGSNGVRNSAAEPASRAQADSRPSHSCRIGYRRSSSCSSGVGANYATRRAVGRAYLGRACDLGTADVLGGVYTAEARRMTLLDAYVSD